MTQADLFLTGRTGGTILQIVQCVIIKFPEELPAITRRLFPFPGHAIAPEDRGGLTTEELSTVTGIAYSALQPRTSELRDRGGIIDSGHRRPNRSGKSAIVWKART